MSQQLSSYSSELNNEKEEEEEVEEEKKGKEEKEEKEGEEEEITEKKEASEKSKKVESNIDSQSQYSSEVYKYHNNTIQFNQLKEEIKDKKAIKGPKLMIMVIPKTNKDLPLPLNTLYFFLELFSYENGLKQLTDQDNKLGIKIIL